MLSLHTKSLPSFFLLFSSKINQCRQPRKLTDLHPITPSNSHPPFLSPIFSSHLLPHANTPHHSLPLLDPVHPPLAVRLRTTTAKAMHALWALLRGKVYCGGKRTDVILGGERPVVMRRTCIRRRNSEELDRCHGNWFYGISTGDDSGNTVLEIGDPSRNVIEMIFKATTTDIKRCSITIKQVLKLKNSSETLERFEKFREDVKNRSLKHSNKNPRNTVDGNEQLLFYGINLTCCKQSGPSDFCKNLNCSICRIIQSGSNTARKKTGIWLSTSCQDIINMNVNSHVNNVKMAITVCRVIAGRVVNMFDKSYEGDYDSIAAVKPDRVFVKYPSAVLPCFVIVLNCRYFG